ncbi:MAG: hypothetical protein JWO36_1426 [Myxococcales bacterium]|nr:hypothetical protein [Myxococcales bacterium]
MVAGSAILGLALHPVTPMAPLVGGLFGMAVGAGLGYGRPKLRIAAAAIAAVPLILTTPTWPALALVAGVLSLGLTAGVRGIRGVVSVMLGAATTLLAMWAALRIGHANVTVTWSPWLTDGVSAAAMGMVGIFGVLPRHLQLSIDEVRAAVRKLPTELDTEVRGLCDRAVAIWTGASDKLGDQDPGRNLLRDGVLKTLEVASKSAEVRVSGASEAELAKRMADLDQRIAAATDTEVKTQYQSARAALDDQRRYRDHIRQNHERLIARMHNHVTTLEKFQLAAGGLAAARVASAGATAMKQLEELSQDVAASGEALAEMELGAAPEPSPVTVETVTTETKPAAAVAQA